MNPPEREQLVALVTRLMTADFRDQEAQNAGLLAFMSAVPHPRASDLIFYWHLEFDHEPTPEEIVDRALSYRSIEL